MDGSDRIRRPVRRLLVTLVVGLARGALLALGVAMVARAVWPTIAAPGWSDLHAAPVATILGEVAGAVAIVATLCAATVRRGTREWKPARSR